MKAGDALDTSDPHDVQNMRQPWPDPFKTVEGFLVKVRPNWGYPYEEPVEFSGSESAPSDGALAAMLGARNEGMRAIDV